MRVLQVILFLGCVSSQNCRREQEIQRRRERGREEGERGRGGGEGGGRGGERE